MAAAQGPRMGTLMGLVLLFAALGAPLLALVWEAANDLLNGHFDARRWLLAVPALALFVLLLRLLSRAVQRVAAPADRPGPFPPARR